MGHPTHTRYIYLFDDSGLNTRGVNQNDIPRSNRVHGKIKIIDDGDSITGYRSKD
jgi:hypothetical protein